MQNAHKAHATPQTYLTVFGWLAVLTVIEIAVSATPSIATAFGFSPLPDALRVAVLAVLVVIAIVKAALVVLFYMHLRYDSRWYTLILFVGVFFALLIGRLLLAILK